MKTIAKEELIGFRYSRKEVLPDPNEIKLRNMDLERALALGNLEHGKVKITFLDQSLNLFQVGTTVWAVTDDYVCLKGSLSIPKRAIIQIG
ncbi:hypothetical protein SAMN04488057_115127 [Cyclobacterium lianum]|uniref:Uncharacterized protein n=1 Tax=Cyclobacterium lianum TaxID=388280 RepID=A0A1M7Q9X4_9BACT|nr:hypothetical protein [Cyclobacterium lianum]SHN27496.1 hypothetical protein SAMN04488057_115127 [Cyclobacterium lianum]